MTSTMTIIMPKAKLLPRVQTRVKKERKQEYKKEYKALLSRLRLKLTAL